MLRLDPPAEDLLPEPFVDNRRRFPRLQLALRVWLIGGRYTMYLRVHDLSRGGLSVRAPVPFRAGDPIEIRLELPDGTTAEARAEIVWTRTINEGMSGARMGARFLGLPKGRDALYRLVPEAV